VAAGLATLRALQAPGFFDALERVTQSLADQLSAKARSAGIDFCARSVGGMFGIYFRAQPPASYAEVMECDGDRFKRFFHAMLQQGVYLAPSAFEAGFVSAAHGEVELAHTLQAAERAFRDLAAQPG
jgi:glutamate-1-semialdehyde 2,1-aminomutase